MAPEIYLDYAATTPVDPAVAEVMAACLGDPRLNGNPSSAHSYGRRAAEVVEKARAQVARLVGIDPGGVVFTSGATESDNLAISGLARLQQQGGRHIVSQFTEHKAVLDVLKALENDGYEVTLLPVDEDGIVSVEALERALRDDTVLVSIMHVNNETGACQDVAEIGALCRDKGVVFHVDAAQSAARQAIDMKRMNIDLLSLTAHKMYGPKGVGALCMDRDRVPLIRPLMFGGAQEAGFRPGTLPTHQIAGLGAACELALRRRSDDMAHIAALSARLAGYLQTLPGVRVNGRQSHRAEGILSVTFGEVEGESLMYSLSGLAVSAGAACNSSRAEPSIVLRAMGLSDRDAQGTVRFSIGRRTTEREIDRAFELVEAGYAHVAAMLPGSTDRPAGLAEDGGHGYADEVVRAFASPPNAGPLPPGEGRVIRGEAGSPEDGAWIALEARVSAGKICAMAFRAYGCPHTIAACSRITENLAGSDVSSLGALDLDGIRAALDIPMEKLGRVLILEDAMRDCFAAWQDMVDKRAG
jgi:cysteine desulfurase